MAITLPLFGCSNVDVKKEIIENALNQKYGEEFVLDRIGGDLSEPPNDTNKGYAYSLKYPNRLFEVQINKNKNEVIDNYLDVLASLKQEIEIKKLLANYDVDIKCRVGSYWYPPINVDTNIAPNEYLNLDKNIDCIAFLIVPTTSDKSTATNDLKVTISKNKDRINNKIMFRVVFIDDVNKLEIEKKMERFTSLADFYSECEDEYSEYATEKIKPFE